MREIKVKNNNNIDNANKNKNNINTYGEFEVKEKVFRYCFKCGKELPEGSSDKFCDFYCRSEYYAEIRKEADACFNQWCGKD